MTNLAENIKYCRKRKGMTQAELADVCKVSSYTVVQTWERGVYEPKSITVRLLADLFGETMQDLYTKRIEELDAERAARPKNVIDKPLTRQVPILGTISCGEPIMAEQNLDGYAEAPVSNCDFCLRCKGDSMTGARIYDGDIVYIKAQPDVENGQIAAVLIDGEATLKRVYVFADHLILRPENPAYKDLVFDNRNDVRILGLAVAFTGMIK